MIRFLLLIICASFPAICFCQEQIDKDFDKVELYDASHLNKRQYENLINHDVIQKIDSIHIHSNCKLISISRDSVSKLEYYLRKHDFRIIDNKSIIKVLTNRTDIKKLVLVASSD